MLESIMIANPKLSIIVLAVAITFVITLVTKKFTNQDRMKELKAKQKECQKQMKEHTSNPEKMKELQSEMMSCSGEMMKSSFKPMLITMLPLLLLFGWIRGVFALTSLASSWIWYYIIASMVSSIALRKVMDVA